MKFSVSHLKKILPLYIARGNPSKDTLKTYNKSINRFMSYCRENGQSPEYIRENDARLYIRELFETNMSKSSVAINLSALKAFYNVAVVSKMLPENPFVNIQPPIVSSDNSEFHYLTPEEVKLVYEKLKTQKLPEVVVARNLSLFLLMSVEGLRSVEVMRMNDTDINMSQESILIHGKGGRENYIYPCDDTFKHLLRYMELRGETEKDELGKMTFISYGTTSQGNRLTRQGLRTVINKALNEVNLKISGFSCHMLRHSCGTNLYEATKDLRLVQETLRHKSVNVTSRYAHISELQKSRKTSVLSPLA